MIKYVVFKILFLIIRDYSVEIVLKFLTSLTYSLFVFYNMN